MNNARHTLNLLSGGAAQGVVQSMQDQLLAAGLHIAGRFGAVGAMNTALLDGAPCDAVILTAKLVRALQESGHVISGSQQPLGNVETGIAVLPGQPRPDVSTPEALKAALLKAPAIYFPDPARATAGIHFASVLDRLGIADEVRARLRTFPNGLAAMGELVKDALPWAMGCTQVTEIRYTSGMDYVGSLPAGYELITEYVAGVCSQTRQPEAAERFIALVAGPQASAERRRLGFDR